ncbi:MAG TPA: amidohydrolase [Desulfobacteraceae bacterium]|nr:amidohydrolase [Desulfobacteraceae bacterium]
METQQMDETKREFGVSEKSGKRLVVIRGGTVLTMTGDLRPLKDTEIQISDGIIKAIGGQSDLSEPARPEVVDATDCVVAPGLVNSHTHLAMTLFRGFSDDLPLRRWLFEKIFPAEAAFLSPETVYWGALLGCLEMISSGTTCFADGYFFPESTLEAVSDSGMRALIAQGVIDFPAPGIKDPEKNIDAAASFIEKTHSLSSLITPGLFCHSPITCSTGTLKRAAEISRGHSVPIQIHLSETLSERAEIETRHRMKPVEYLESTGILGPDLIAVHAVHIDKDETVRLRENGVKIVHTPESNMKLCSGVAPVQGYIGAGMHVALGTDGCASNNDLDMFREMDKAAKLSKMSEKDPTSLDARTVMKMATCWGAEALGLGDLIGTLEIGKRADLMIIDMAAPHLCPLYDPYSALVYAARGSDVRDVFIDGAAVFRNRRFTRLNPVEIMERVREMVADRHAEFQNNCL